MRKVKKKSSKRLNLGEKVVKQLVSRFDGSVSTHTTTPAVMHICGDLYRCPKGDEDCPHSRQHIAHQGCFESCPYVSKGEERRKGCVPAGAEPYMKMKAEEASKGRTVENRPKLRIRLEKWDKALVMQVLYMDERFRATDGCNNTFVSSSKVKIISGSHPCLYKHETGLIQSVYLRGNYNHDLIISNAYFKNNVERDLSFEIIKEALKEWAVNWTGFKEDDKEIKQEADSSVMEF